MCERRMHDSACACTAPRIRTRWSGSARQPRSLLHNSLCLHTRRRATTELDDFARARRDARDLHAVFPFERRTLLSTRAPSPEPSCFEATVYTIVRKHRDSYRKFSRGSSVRTVLRTNRINQLYFCLDFYFYAQRFFRLNV